MPTSVAEEARPWSNFLTFEIFASFPGFRFGFVHANFYQKEAVSLLKALRSFRKLVLRVSERAKDHALHPSQLLPGQFTFIARN